jgi:hypothetical protein
MGLFETALQSELSGTARVEFEAALEIRLIETGKSEAGIHRYEESCRDIPYRHRDRDSVSPGRFAEQCPTQRSSK